MKAGLSPQAETAGREPLLRELTRRWFFFLTTFRQLESRPGAEEVKNRLDGLLRDMEREAGPTSGLEPAFRQVEHALVYFADEILLNCGWADEAAWARDELLLEKRRFDTRLGGQDFFDRLEAAFAGGDPDVIEIYHKCLALGFRGKHVREPIQLAELRRRALALSKPEPIQTARFCPEAYEDIDPRPFVKFPGVARARIILGLTFILAFIYGGAHLVLRGQLGDLKDRARDVYEQVNTMSPVSPNSSEGG